MKKLLMAVLFILAMAVPALAQTFYLFGTGTTGYFGTDAAGFGAPITATGWSFAPSTGVWTANPTLSNEKVSNGGFDSDTTGWTPKFTATLASVAGGQTGNCCQVTRGTSQVCGEQDLASIPIGTWVQGQFYGLDGTGGAATARAGFYDNNNVLVGALWSFGASWTQKVFTGIITKTGVPYIYIENTGANGTTAFFDDISIKTITLSTAVALRDFGAQKAPYVQAVIPAGLNGGVITRAAANLSSYLLATYDRTNSKIRLDKCVSGTVANLIAPATATYADNRAIEIRFADANTAQLYYNNVQIGTNQDVSDVSTGTLAGIFGTTSAVQLKAFAAN